MESNNRDAPERLFVVDEMFGKLARWLRMMGLDTVHRSPFDDAELIRIARDENRIIVTKDRKILKAAAGTEVWFIDENIPFHQIVEVVRRAGINPKEKAFTRCGICNTLLKSISKEEVAGKAPPFVYATHSEYRCCPKCDKIYWRGAHRTRMEKFFDDVAEAAFGNV